MATWEPEGIDIADRDDIEDDSWDENAMNDLQTRYEELRQFNIKYNKSHDKATREETSIYIDSTRNDIEELVANQIYDKLTTTFNRARERLGINNGTPIEEPSIRYNSFNPIRPRGGGLRCPDGQTHSCQSETSYPMMPKLGDF